MRGEVLFDALVCEEFLEGCCNEDNLLLRTYVGVACSTSSQRGKKRLDAVHYEIVGRTGEGMIVVVKSDWEKGGCGGEAGCCEGKQKICLADAQVMAQSFFCMRIDFSHI
jgi:hypothetical protein